MEKNIKPNEFIKMAGNGTYYIAGESKQPKSISETFQQELIESIKRQYPSIKEEPDTIDQLGIETQNLLEKKLEEETEKQKKNK